MSERYPLNPAFERELVAALVRSSGFYSRFAEYLEDDAFANLQAQTLLRGCRLYFDETHRGPGSDAIVFQRLQRLHEEGALSMDSFALAMEYAERLPEEFDEQAVSHEFSQVLKRRLGAETMDKAFMTFAQRGDMREIARRIEVVESIGNIDLSIGDDLDQLANDLASSSKVDRLSFGCFELDNRTGGGRIRGEFGFHLAPPKTGKSLTLVQDSVIGVRSGYNTLGVTLELPSDMWRARHLGGLTGTPVNDITSDPHNTVAWERREQLIDDYMRKGQKLGKFLVKKLPGGATSLQDILNLVDRVEQHWGEPVEVLVVDYLDKTRGSNTNLGMYEQMLEVYEGTRLWAETNKRWACSASQAKGHVKEGEMPGLTDCADSQNKVRVTDWMTGIQKHISEDLRGNVSIQLLAGRNYEETEALGPFPRGSMFGTFFESVALPGSDVMRALQNASEEDIHGSVFG